MCDPRRQGCAHREAGVAWMRIQDFKSEAEFYAWAEKAAAEFNLRYGITDGVWSDDKLAQALADHNLPPLEKIPDQPRGMMARTNPLATTAGERRAWRRTNASHLLGHVIAHNGERCDGCKYWGR